MAERQTSTQRAQIGKEVVHGTAVACPTRLLSGTIDLDIKSEFKQSKQQGYKSGTNSYLTKEWSEGKIGGLPDYVELGMILANLVALPTVGEDAEADYLLFQSNPENADTYLTFTTEKGDAIRAHKAAYCAISEFGLDSSRADVTQSGAFFGRKITDNSGLTADAEALVEEPKPIVGSDIDLFVADSHAGLSGGPAQRSGLLKSGWKLSGRRQPVWTQDTRAGSFSSDAEPDNSLVFSISVKANAEGMEYLTSARRGDTLFVRYQATSQLDVAANVAKPAQYFVEAAVNVSAIKEFSDDQGVYMISYELTAIKESAWGLIYRFGLRNALTLAGADANAAYVVPA